MGIGACICISVSLRREKTIDRCMTTILGSISTRTVLCRGVSLSSRYH